jgi:hypothetical protein
VTTKEQILLIIKARVGRKNSVKVWELCEKLNLRDERNIRRHVRGLKLAGHPIAFCSDGYYWPDGTDDCSHSIAIMRNEEKQIRIVRQAQEKAFKRVFPGYAEQMSLFDREAA